MLVERESVAHVSTKIIFRNMKNWRSHVSLREKAFHSTHPSRPLWGVKDEAIDYMRRKRKIRARAFQGILLRRLESEV